MMQAKMEKKICDKRRISAKCLVEGKTKCGEKCKENKKSYTKLYNKMKQQEQRLAKHLGPKNHQAMKLF